MHGKAIVGGFDNGICCCREGWGFGHCLYTIAVLWERIAKTCEYVHIKSELIKIQFVGTLYNNSQENIYKP